MSKSQGFRLHPAVPGVVAVAIFIAALLVLKHELQAVSLAQIVTEFKAIPFQSFIVAALLTLLGYLLLTCYDWLALAYLGVKAHYKDVAPVSFAAFAVGNNVGISTLSGGAIRYRAYSLQGLGTTQIAAIIAFISFTFILGGLTMLGLTLLFEPAQDLSPLHLSPLTLRIIGMLLLGLPVSYLVLLATKRDSVNFWVWKIDLPDWRIGLTQLLLSVFDLLIASMVLYVLLGSDAQVNILVFVGAFMLALIIAVISAVPGGIGIFESSMVLLLPQIPAPILLGAMLAYRLIYYLIPLLIAVALIVIHELLEHRSHLQRISSASIAWSARLVPQAIGVIIFIAGTYLLVRGNLPTGFGLSRAANTFVALPVLEVSHLLSSAIGVGLLVVARGLFRRLHRALLATLVLLAAAVVTSILQYHGLLPLLFLISLMLLAWLSRAEFYRGRALLDQKFSSEWIASIILVVLSAIGLGLFAHRNTAYSSELWWQFTVNGEASRMLRASLLSILLMGTFALLRFLRGNTQVLHKPDQAELARVKEIVNATGSSFSNIALLGDKRFLFHASGCAFLMYQISGNSWIALGDPLGDSQYFEELLWQYREACDANNARCVFYQVSDTWLPLYIDLDLAFYKLGEEAVVDLSTFNLSGNKAADFRQAINRARKNGAEFSVIPASQVMDVMAQLANVSASWLHNKAADEKGFSLGYFDAAYIVNFDCAVIKIKGEIVAFANLWKSGDGKELSLDLMRYTEQAPKGVMDYLFTEILLWGQENHFHSFNLGMAPLSGLEHHALAPTWHKFGNLVYRFGEHFYNFEGLRHYKEKFEPRWEARFLACKGGMQIPAVLLDTTVLIGGGVRGILFK